jgi:flagellar motor switch protein FliM
MSKLTTTYWVASSVAKQSSLESITSVQRKLEKTLIPVVVELGRVSITVRELLDIAVGDVLQLETSLESDLNIMIGQREKFSCKPGLSGKRLAVQITGSIAKGDDENE